MLARCQEHLETPRTVQYGGGWDEVGHRISGNDPMPERSQILFRRLTAICVSAGALRTQAWQMRASVRLEALHRAGETSVSGQPRAVDTVTVELCGDECDWIAQDLFACDQGRPIDGAVLTECTSHHGSRPLSAVFLGRHARGR
jgi:hypothetical protein